MYTPFTQVSACSEHYIVTSWRRIWNCLVNVSACGLGLQWRRRPSSLKGIEGTHGKRRGRSYVAELTRHAMTLVSGPCTRDAPAPQHDSPPTSTRPLRPLG